LLIAIQKIAAIIYCNGEFCSNTPPICIACNNFLLVLIGSRVCSRPANAIKDSYGAPAMSTTVVPLLGDPPSSQNFPLVHTFARLAVGRILETGEVFFADCAMTGPPISLRNRQDGGGRDIYYVNKEVTDPPRFQGYIHFSSQGQENVYGCILR
jgi:hypothetical protein